MNKRFDLGKTMSLFLTFLLVISRVIPATSAPVFAFAENPSGAIPSYGETFWADSISEMLAAGEYEEGVVIAGIDMSKAKQSEDPGSALETEMFAEDTEELICVDSGDLTTGQDFYAWLRGLKDKLTGQDDDNVCITSISRSDMTTEQILELLSKDDSVVFAEPNYLVSMESTDDDAYTDDVLAQALESIEASVLSEHEAELMTGSESVERLDTEEEENAIKYEADLMTDITSDELLGSGEETSPYENDAVNPSLTAYQWGSSKDVTFRAADMYENISMNIPGWPDGSNMDHEIVVAVLDYPVDFTNPDLSDKAYTFSPELMEELGCDEHGFNATWQSEDGRLELFDGGDHGTHVAGIIGAAWNGRGISGVGSNVRIVSIQISNEDGKTSLINALRGMNFVKKANEKGAGIRITNNSWGLYQNSKALDAAVTELGENGVVTFIGSGNDGRDLTYFETVKTKNPYAIIVASMGPTGELAESSNYGYGIVDLAAPGVDIMSCIMSRSAKFNPSSDSNKYYEGFEDGASLVDIYQIDAETGEKVEGSDGIIIPSDEAMGFEGEHVIGVRTDASYAENFDGELFYSFKIDFGELPDVRAGDSLGFAYGSRNILGVSSVSENYEYIFSGTVAGSWDICDYTITESDLEAESLSITISMYMAGDADEVFFDAIGIGSERSPYGLKSGTSMASPAAAGAGAVIASRHYDEIESMNAESAETLANLVRSSVRQIPSLTGKVSTEGLIDLSVDTEVPSELSPHITDITVSGNEVNITGSNFGSSSGSVTVSKFVHGMEPAVMVSEIEEWGEDRVTLLLDSDFTGIIEAEMTACNGKKDAFVKFISKSREVFETDHSFAGETGDPFEFNDAEESASVMMGDLETSGVMLPFGDMIYYIPVIAKVEEYPAYRTMYCYNTAEDRWVGKSQMPSWLLNISGTAFGGKLYIKGIATEVDGSGDIPYPSDKYWEEEEETCIYSYTPGEDNWEICSADNVPLYHVLFSTDKGLMLAGSRILPDEENWYVWDSGILEYDPVSGAGEKIRDLPVNIERPIVTCAFGCICICNSIYAETLYVLHEDSAEVTEVTMPDGCDERFTLAGNEDILMLVGPVSADGFTETYCLTAGQDKFVPYAKRVSDAPLFEPASAIMNDRLYVIGASHFEPGQRVFRSTLLFTAQWDKNPEPTKPVKPDDSGEPAKPGKDDHAGEPSKDDHSGVRNQPTPAVRITNSPGAAGSENAAASAQSVTNVKTVSSAKTGDESSVLTWLTWMSVSLAVVLIAVLCGRRDSA